MLRLEGHVMDQQVRVLVVDDQPRARQSLRALLTTLPEVKEVREAVNGLEAVRLVEQSQPDVVLMDILMPVMDGLEATRQIKAARQGIRILVLSMYADYKANAIAAGADAFMTKGESPEQLLAALFPKSPNVNGAEKPTS